MSLVLRYMELSDIPQVVAIDRASFDPPWPARSYAYEITESTYSYMLTLEKREQIELSGWRRLLNNLSGSSNGRTRLQCEVVGYGGLWKIADEAHISTIASHPNYRGHGYGELLLAGMVGRSIQLGAAYIVLEVRLSNTVAQKLYHKYDFKTVGVKKNYYRNNNEDAYDMRAEITPTFISRYKQRIGHLQQRIDYIDSYSNNPHERLD